MLVLIELSSVLQLYIMMLYILLEERGELIDISTPYAHSISRLLLLYC